MRPVLLALSWYDRLLHEGVADYAAEHGWFLDPGILRSRGHIPRGWHGDGIITHPDELRTELANFLIDAKLPTVIVQQRVATLPYPVVATNPALTAQLAFDYLRGDKGFQCFGTYGPRRSLRRKSFEECVQNHGFECHFLRSRGEDLELEAERIREWLTSGPLPMAVYCNNDDVALTLINLAMDVGIDVPHQLAVLGTDNTPLICKCSRVPLSSVDTDLYAVGYQAAALLDRMMNGESPPSEPTLLPPKCIVERASTDTLAAKSPHVRKAIAIMRELYGEGLTIADVVAQVGISHDGLKKAFHRDFGQPPSVILRKIRMKQAANLLRTTTEKVRTISHMVGMGNEKYFTTAFKKCFGVPPKRYRANQV
jgi:LacI family transcriptional regulator